MPRNKKRILSLESYLEECAEHIEKYKQWQHDPYLPGYYTKEIHTIVANINKAFSHVNPQQATTLALMKKFDQLLLDYNRLIQG